MSSGEGRVEFAVAGVDVSCADAFVGESATEKNAVSGRARESVLTSWCWYGVPLLLLLLPLPPPVGASAPILLTTEREREREGG